MSKKSGQNISLDEFNRGAKKSEPVHYEQDYEEEPANRSWRNNNNDERPPRRQHQPRESSFEGWSREGFGSNRDAPRGAGGDDNGPRGEGGYRDRPPREDRRRFGGGGGAGFNRDMFGSAPSQPTRGDDDDDDFESRTPAPSRGGGGFDRRRNNNDGAGFNRNMFGSASTNDGEERSLPPARRQNDRDNNRSAGFGFLSRDQFGTATPTVEKEQAPVKESRKTEEVDSDGFTLVKSRGDKAVTAPQQQQQKPKQQQRQTGQTNSIFDQLLDEDEDDEVHDDEAHEVVDTKEEEEVPEPKTTTPAVEEQVVKAEPEPTPAPAPKKSALSRFLGKGKPAVETKSTGDAAATAPQQQEQLQPLQQQQPAAVVQPAKEQPQQAQISQLLPQTTVAWGGAAATPAAQPAFSFGGESKPAPKQQQQQPKKAQQQQQQQQQQTEKATSTPAAPRQANSILAKAAGGEVSSIPVGAMKKNIRDITPFEHDAAKTNFAKSLAYSVANNDYTVDILAFHWIRAYTDGYVKALRKTNPSENLKDEGADIAKDIMIRTLQQLNKTNPEIITETFAEHSDEMLLKYAPTHIVNEETPAVQKEKLIAFYKESGLSKCLNPTDSGEDDTTALDSASSLSIALAKGLTSPDAAAAVVTANKDGITKAVNEDVLKFFVDCFDVFNVQNIDGASVSAFMSALLDNKLITFEQADQWRSDAERTEAKRQTIFKLSSWFRENEPQIQSYYDDEDEDDEIDY